MLYEVITEETAFSFNMRIPAWCKQPEILINGKQMKNFNIEKGMVKIERKFADGDKVELNLPMEMKLTSCGIENEGVAVERGPLVYSLPVKNKTITFPYIGDPKLKDFPNKLMYPASDWSYALDITDINEAEFIETNADVDHYPWNIEHTPVKIKVPAQKVKNWTIDGTKHVSTFPNKLELSGKKETLELVPLGTTYLRMTIFPKTK